MTMKTKNDELIVAGARWVRVFQGLTGQEIGP